MSVPCLSYGCTACGFSGWDAGLVGLRYYADGKEQVRLRTVAGWCYRCAAVSPIERLPDEAEAAEEAELEAGLRAALAERERLAAARPAPPWWAFWRRRVREHDGLGYEIDRATAGLADRRLRRRLLEARRSGPRCLICGSDECAALPPPPVEPEFVPSDPRPRLLGFVHPGCGGDITVASEGVRFNFGRPEPKFYDREGRRLQGRSGAGEG